MGKGFVNENGFYEEPMTKAEAKASVKDMEDFVKFMEEEKQKPTPSGQEGKGEKSNGDRAII